jgi:DNA-binding response OmpR family regulator
MKKSVLVVDDEWRIMATMCAILEASDYTAVGAASGDEAISKVSSFCPDLLLCDVMMPGLNGFETGLQVKKLCPNCRLLFFTGNPDVWGLAEGIRKSGHDFETLLKPVHPSLLIDRVKAVLSASN